MDRLFLDANVLFSAAYRRDAGIARLWGLSDVELITSPYATEEARINLIEEDQRQRRGTLLERVRIVTGVSGLQPGLALPEKDLPILQAEDFSIPLFLKERQIKVFFRGMRRRRPPF